MAVKRNIFSGLRKTLECLNSAERKETFRLETWKVLNDFVYGGCYTSYRNKELFLKAEDQKDSVIAKLIGVSEAGVRQARRRISEEVYAVLGDNILDKILYGTEHDCSVLCDNISIVRTLFSGEDFILGDVKERLYDSYIGSGDEVFNLRDCKNEMLFLSLFTLNRFSNLVLCLDSEKLNYLLRLLDGKSGGTSERLVALKYINNLKNTDDISKLLQIASKASK